MFFWKLCLYSISKLTLWVLTQSCDFTDAHKTLVKDLLHFLENGGSHAKSLVKSHGTLHQPTNTSCSCSLESRLLEHYLFEISSKTTPNIYTNDSLVVFNAFPQQIIWLTSGPYTVRVHIQCWSCKNIFFN